MNSRNVQIIAIVLVLLSGGLIGATIYSSSTIKNEDEDPRAVAMQELPTSTPPQATYPSPAADASNPPPTTVAKPEIPPGVVRPGKPKPKEKSPEDDLP